MPIIWEHPFLQNKSRVWHTLVVFLAFASHGFGFGVVGPTLLDLEISTQSTLKLISFMVPARAIGLAVGATMCNIILKKMDAQLLMSIGLAVGAIFEIAIPFSNTWWLVCVLFSVNGFCFGIVENCCNLLIVQLWREDCPAILQILYFCIGAGASVSPLIVRPLLLPADDEEAQKFFSPSDVRVQYAFLVIGIEIAVASLASFFMYFSARNKDVDQKEVACDQQNVKLNESVKQKRLRVSSFGMAMIFMFLACGIEVTFGSYIMPFVLKAKIHVDKKTGALMQSVFWACFTSGRLLTCFYVNRMGPRNSALMSLFLCLIGSVFLTPFSDGCVVCMWVGSVLLGIGLSPMWGNLFAFVQMTFPSHASSLTSALITSACIGECVIPIIVSTFIDHNHMSFMFITCGIIVLMTGMFAILSLLVSFYRNEEAGKAVASSG